MLRRTFASLVWLGGTAGTSSLGVETRSRHGQFVNVVPEGTQQRQATAEGSVAPHATLFFTPETRNAVVDASKTSKPKQRSSKWNRALRADIYDELLKLPLRFALHDFGVLRRHMENNLSSRSYVAAIEAQQAAATAAADSQQHASQTSTSTAAIAPADEEDSGVYMFKQGTEAAEEKMNDTDDGHSFYAVAGRVSAVGYAPPLGPADPIDVIPFFVHRSANGHLPGTLHSMHARNLMPAFVLKIENSVEGDLFRFEEELMKIFPTKKIFVRSHCIYVYNVGKDGMSVLHHWLLGLGF